MLKTGSPKPSKNSLNKMLENDRVVSKKMTWVKFWLGQKNRKIIEFWLSQESKTINQNHLGPKR